MFRVTQKMKAVRVALLQWGGGNARSLTQSISAKRNLLTSLEMDCPSDSANQQLSHARNVTKTKLNELIAQENTYWHQQSKISWMKDGDCNSKYFHVAASLEKKVQ